MESWNQEDGEGGEMKLCEYDLQISRLNMVKEVFMDVLLKLIIEIKN